MSIQVFAYLIEIIPVANVFLVLLIGPVMGLLAIRKRKVSATNSLLLDAE